MHILVKERCFTQDISQKAVMIMSLIVQKFGGSSVRDVQRLRHVARRISDVYHQGNQVVVVVSAQGKTTDQLIGQAMEVTKTPSGREMDVLLSTGEQMSISLLAMALNQIGCPALSLTGWQVGIHTDAVHQNARILQVDTQRILQQLEKGNIVIVAGFQGVDEGGNITTLGRGGSDTTAVALASALNADHCQIFTDVEGVYTADPRIVPEAVKLPEITYNDMLVMASMGAKVLHDRSVELAKEKQVHLEVLSSLTEAPGTLVWGVKDGPPSMQGITADRTVLRYHLTSISLEDASHFMTELYRRQVHPDLTEQPADNELLFTVSQHHRQTVEETLKERNLWAEADERWAKVTVVGSQLHSIPHVKQEVLSELEKAGIPFGSSWLGERRYSVLLPRDAADEGVRALHRVLLRHRE